ncbi:F-box-like protein [Ceratobasidium sp. AG-Ba]|nr:F-box-like protein [Ceratobasidium sp. AG-Ba]QRW05516.1 F-box-like protein [Ceratobasidium sp. AG-Ba]
MAACLPLSAYDALPRIPIVLTHHLLQQYMQCAAALFAEIEATRARLASLEQEHQTVSSVISDAKAQLNSAGVNRLPTELISKIFELVSAEQDGAIIWLSHVCRDWRATAFASPRAWSKLLADLSAPANTPTAERALAYLERSGACPLDIRLVTTTGQLSNPSNGLAIALHKSLPRWRSFSLVSSSSGVYSEFVKSLSGQASSLEELNLVFQSDSSRAHGDQPRLPSNFSVQAPSLRFLRLDGVGINLEWASTLHQLETLELVQHQGSSLAYDALLRVLSTCAQSLRTVSIRARVSDVPRLAVGSERTPVLFPRLETLDLALHTSPVSSLLADFEAPNLRSLSLQDTRIPSDRWCSLGIRSFLREPASQLRHLRLCQSGLDDDDLLWMLKRIPKLESLEMLGSTNTDAVLRSLARPLPANVQTQAESWMVPALNSLTVEQCHQITGSALVDSIKARNTCAVDSSTHIPIRHLRVRNCYQFERRHSVKLNKLSPALQLDAEVVSFSFGLQGMRARSPFENTLGVPPS